MKRLLLTLLVVFLPALALAQSPDPYSAAPTQALMPPIIVFPGSANSVQAVDGTAAAPSVSYAADPSTGFRRSGFGVVVFDSGAVDAMAFGGNATGLTMHALSPIQWGSAALSSTDTALSRGGAGKITLTGTTPMFQLGGTTSSFPALKQSGAGLQVRLADDSNYTTITASTLNLTSTLGLQTTLLSVSVPTMGACGTSPSVTANNGTAAFSVNVGTGGTASTCVVNLPTNTTGWICDAFDITNPTTGGGYFVKQTAGTTTSVTFTGYNTAGAATAWTASDILRVKCTGY